MFWQSPCSQGGEGPPQQDLLHCRSFPATLLCGSLGELPLFLMLSCMPFSWVKYWVQMVLSWMLSKEHLSLPPSKTGPVMIPVATGGVRRSQRIIPGFSASAPHKGPPALQGASRSASPRQLRVCGERWSWLNSAFYLALMDTHKEPT